MPYTHLDSTLGNDVDEIGTSQDAIGRTFSIPVLPGIPGTLEWLCGFNEAQPALTDNQRVWHTKRPLGRLRSWNLVV